MGPGSMKAQPPLAVSREANHKSQAQFTNCNFGKNLSVPLQRAMILRYRLHCAALLVLLNCVHAFNLPVRSFKTHKILSHWAKATLPQHTSLQAAEGSLIDAIASVTADDEGSQSDRTVLDGSLAPTPVKQEPFSLETAVMLAGFAFESYNDPVDVKWNKHKDGSKLAYLSEDFIRQSFAGIMTVSILRVEGQLSPAPADTATFNGSTDFDAAVSVLLEDKILQSSRQSTPKKRKGKSRWGDHFLLYVSDPDTAQLTVSVEAGQGFFQPDVTIAAANLTLAELLPDMMSETDTDWSGWVTLQPDAAYKTDKPPAVRVQLDVRFVPFGESAEIDNDVADDVADALEKLHFEGPKGVLLASTSLCGHHLLAATLLSVTCLYYAAVCLLHYYRNNACLHCTPGLDWRDLSAAAQGALEAARRFECIAFVDNDDTDTQCAVWRDAANKRLILSFRGTSHWKDVLTGSCSTTIQQHCAAAKLHFALLLLTSHCAHTDASLLQESLDLLLPGDEGILRWEAQQLRARQEGLVELLAAVRESMPEPLKDAVALVPGVAESLETASSSLQSLQSSLEATEAGLSVETVLQEVAGTATAAAAGTAGDVEGTQAAAAAALAAGADAAAAPDAAVLCDVLDGVQEAVQSSTSAGKARADNEITGWFSMLADSVMKLAEGAEAQARGMSLNSANSADTSSTADATAAATAAAAAAAAAAVTDISTGSTSDSSASSSSTIALAAANALTGGTAQQQQPQQQQQQQQQQRQSSPEALATASSLAHRLTALGEALQRGTAAATTAAAETTQYLGGRFEQINAAHTYHSL
eukprot:21104-Heterococcus_DN1.PRE.3